MLLVTVVVMAAVVSGAFGMLFVRSRREIAALRLRFPDSLLDIDAEVVRLEKLKIALQLELEQAKERADRDRDSVEKEITSRREEWERKYGEAVSELQRLHGEVDGLSEEAEIQSFGLYKPRYSFADIDGFKQKLTEVRDREKAILKAKNAALCSTAWQVGGSATEGRRMVERQMKLMLRAFNGECDAATANVTWKNVVALQDRVRKNFAAINRLGETVQCEITSQFLELRLEEIQLAHEYAEKVQADREEQRQLREQMRDEEKATREIEREKEEAEREEELHQRALAKARGEIERANESERAALDAKIAKLESLLAKAQERKQRAISQAELTRLGHVYILSNEGAFGPNVFKIGMTRRLDPMDRVEELGSASVPFRFDVHAIIRSDDAPALEQKIHDALEPHRVNLVNSRKEYFRVPLEKVIDLVNQHHGKVQFSQVADAADYRKTLAIRAEREAMVVGKAAHASAVTRVDEVRTRYEQLKKAMS